MCPKLAPQDTHLDFVLALFHYLAGFKSQIQPKHFLHCSSLHFWSLLFQVMCVLHILSRGSFTSGMYVCMYVFTS